MTQPSPIPTHIAIVMDGNGRWATQRKLPRTEGHLAGTDAAKNIVEECAKRGVKVLTLFAFSSENWGRPQEEVDTLMRLFLNSLKERTHELHQNKIRLRFIGEMSQFDPDLREQIERSKTYTKDNDGLELVIAVDYSGRWDIENATKKIAQQVNKNNLKPENITQDVIAENLVTHDLPDPDLIIRTSGEQRISNFLLWQAAYSELYFTKVLWPDFSTEEFEKALDYFATRQRRFGLTDAQTVEGTQTC